MRRADDISEILAIRLSGIGDVVLLLPALERLKSAFRNARLTLMTGSQCVPVARLCPEIDEVVEVDRVALRTGSKGRAALDILGLIRRLRRARFDLAVDFHGLGETSLMARIAGARYRMGVRRSTSRYLGFCFNLDPPALDGDLHVADMFLAAAENVPGVEGKTEIPTPCIRIPKQDRVWAAGLSRPGPTLTLYVGASVTERRWTPAGFGAVASHAARDWGATVFVVGGASREEESLASSAAAAAGHDGGVHVLNGLDIPRMAALLERTDLLVSNDTGPMHIGCALGIPTIGLFGISDPAHYAPRGPMGRYIKRDSIEDIDPRDVIEVMEETRTALAG